MPDPERLRLLMQAAQEMQNRGVPPDSVQSWLMENPTFSALSQEQRSLTGLASAADTPAQPSQHRQLLKQLTGQLSRGASYSQINQQVQEATGGEAQTLGELRRMVDGDRSAALLDYQEQQRGIETRQSAARERLQRGRPGIHGHLPGPEDMMLQAVRGVPFVGEAISQGLMGARAAASAGVEALGSETRFGDAFSERMEDERQRRDDVRATAPVGSFVSENVTPIGAGALFLRTVTGVPARHAAAELLQGRLPRRGHDPSARGVAHREVGRTADRRREEMISLSPIDAGPFQAAAGGAASFSRSGAPILGASAVGGADSFLQALGRAESIEELVEVLGDPVSHAAPGALGAGAFGAGFAVGRTGLELGHRMSTLRSTSNARVANYMARSLGDTKAPTRRWVQNERQRLVGEAREGIISELEGLAPIGNEEPIRQVLQHPRVNERVRKARETRRRDNPDSPEDFVWEDFQKARSDFRKDARMTDDGARSRALSEAAADIDYALEQSPTIGAADRQFREVYTDAVRPYDAFEAGLETPRNMAAEDVAERMREVASVRGEMVPHYEDHFRMGMIRREIRAFNRGEAIELNQTQREQFRMMLGADMDEAAFHEIMGAIESELVSRKWDKAMEGFLKYTSFSLMGSSVLAGSIMALGS